MTHEPDPPDEPLTTDLTDLTGVSLSDVAAAVRDSDSEAEETMRRVAPTDGTQLLVAASFQSAI